MPIYALGDLMPELPDSNRLWIAPDAHVIGRVRLTRDVGVWFGAVLRGDNELTDVGERTNIQEGALLHTVPGLPLAIGVAVTIGHHAIINGCTIGDGSLIGMGATILNGARIGANCLVGANSLVTEGKDFPFGAPAKVVRELAPKALEGLRSSAASYVHSSERFRSSLRFVQ